MEKKPILKKWHPQQERILKSWGEKSSCYRYLHFKAYLKYKELNMRFTMPIIVISTVTGTANFAQETFPVAWQEYVPLGIGGLNLFSAIMATVSQFLKVSELMEAHRVASISYGKLARDIQLELSLPVMDRHHAGVDLINRCSVEYDRLVEQAPPVPGNIIKTFDRVFKNVDDISKPEILDIQSIIAYDQTRETTMLGKVAGVFKTGLNKMFGMADARKPSISNVVTSLREHPDVTSPRSSIPFEYGFRNAKAQVMDELNELKKKNLVSRGTSEPVESEEPEEPVESEEVHVNIPSSVTDNNETVEEELGP